MLLDQATAAPLFFSRISRGKRAIYPGARFETGKNSDQRLAGKQQILQATHARGFARRRRPQAGVGRFGICV